MEFQCIHIVRTGGTGQVRQGMGWEDLTLEVEYKSKSQDGTRKNV